jgi:cobalamin-dependent methionine synthase I
LERRARLDKMVLQVRKAQRVREVPVVLKVPLVLAELQVKMVKLALQALKGNGVILAQEV